MERKKKRIKSQRNICQINLWSLTETLTWCACSQSLSSLFVCLVNLAGRCIDSISVWFLLPAPSPLFCDSCAWKTWYWNTTDVIYYATGQHVIEPQLGGVTALHLYMCSHASVAFSTGHLNHTEQTTYCTVKMTRLGTHNLKTIICIAQHLVTNQD